MNVIFTNLYDTERDVLNYSEELFECWKTNPYHYNDLLQQLEEQFGKKFKDYAPLHIVGDYWTSGKKLVVLDLHPTEPQSKELLDMEQRKRNYTRKPLERSQMQWVNQIYYNMNYFRYVQSEKIQVEYYEQLDQLVQYYEQQASKQTKKYEMLQKNVVQVYLLPFYAEEQLQIEESNEILTCAMRRVKSYFNGRDADLIVITDKKFYEGLVRTDLVKKNTVEGLCDGKIEEIAIFDLEMAGLVQKGLFIDITGETEKEVLRKGASVMRKVTTWNRENYWKNNF